MKIIELTDCHWTRTNHPRYPYVLTEDYVIRFSNMLFYTARKLEFRQLGLTWATLHRSVLTIKAGYAIDGATLAPDPAQVIPACFVHDFMCQFYRVHDAPFTRADADSVFRAIMKLHRFAWRWLYGLGVFFGVLLPKTPVSHLEIIEK